MLEKSFGLLTYLKRPKNYKGGEMPVYLRITVDGIEKELSAKRSGEPSRWNVKGNRASIGILICKEKNRVIAEYALKGMGKPIGVAEYELTQSVPEGLKGCLPTISQIKNGLL